MIKVHMFTWWANPTFKKKKKEPTFTGAQKFSTPGPLSISNGIALRNNICLDWTEPSFTKSKIYILMSSILHYMTTTLAKLSICVQNRGKMSNSHYCNNQLISNFSLYLLYSLYETESDNRAWKMGSNYSSFLLYRHIASGNYKFFVFRDLLFGTGNKLW